MLTRTKKKNQSTERTEKTFRVMQTESMVHSEVQEVRTRFSTMQTSSENIFSKNMTPLQRLGTSTDAFYSNPFEREFGGSSQSNVQHRIPYRDAKMITSGGPSPTCSHRSNLLPTTFFLLPTTYSSSTSRPPMSISPLSNNTRSLRPQQRIAGAKFESKPIAISTTSPCITNNFGTKGNSIKVAPGVVYIFNHEKFDDAKDIRVGTRKDVEILKKTFYGLFKMETKVFNDLKVKDIKAEALKIERHDYTRKACIVVVILTHGTRHDVVHARDELYSIDDEILFPMLRNKTLANKPKIFIIQACKGDYATEQYLHSDAKRSSLNAPLQIAKLYSTFEGFLSYRGSEGSLFIQTLCQNLRRDGFEKNVLEIMEQTICQIVKEYNVRQVPTITHNMTNPLIFGSFV